jgi:hypothetical protein
MFRPVPFLPFVLIAACAIVLAVLTAASARRGLPRPRPGDRVVLVRHNPLFRGGVLALAVLLPAGLTVFLHYSPPLRRDVPFILGLYLVSAGLSTLLVWEGGRFYVLATSVGLEGRSAWRGLRVIAWYDLDAVVYSPLNAWFEFRGRSGERVRAMTFAVGLNDLLRVVEENVPAEALTGARSGYARLGRRFPGLPDEPVLEARRPRRVGEW